jgi:L-amino acid N-acyltransferase
MIQHCEDFDLPGIVAIYNDAVANTNAIWNETLVDIENRRNWWLERLRGGFPVLVARDNNETVGYASFGPFRPFDGYRTSVEHSIYVRNDQRGKGIGKALLEALIIEAKARGKHAMLGGIAHDNAVSIKLHKALGFVETGRLPEVATKFGQWQTLVFMQKILD